jgi:DNA-directed RNA polymerase subunit RPC12/RpoP
MLERMDPKEVAIRCPCCESRIVVDVRTSKIVTWSRAGEVDVEGRPKVTEEDWDAAHRRAKGRLGESVDKFDAGLQREQRREADLDDLWRNVRGDGGGESGGDG